MMSSGRRTMPHDHPRRQPDRRATSDEKLRKSFDYCNPAIVLTLSQAEANRNGKLKNVDFIVPQTANVFCALFMAP